MQKQKKNASHLLVNKTDKLMVFTKKLCIGPTPMLKGLTIMNTPTWYLNKHRIRERKGYKTWKGKSTTL